MILLERERKRCGLSKRALGIKANTDGADISKAELYGNKLYQPQLQRLADALGYTGDPEDLLQEIDNDAAN